MKYVIIVIIILVLIGLIIFLPNIIKKNYKIENINYFYLIYTRGYASNCNVLYRIDNDLKATIKLYGKSEEVTINVDKSVLKEIEEVLVKYDVQKWNGFNKKNNMVNDGDSFDLNIEMENGKKIEADGYASWPKNYSEVINELDEIFLRIYSEDKGD